jgi:hypothetical protein
MFTAKKPLSQHWLYLIHHRYDRTYRTLRKINAGNRLIDLQGSTLACFGINMVPVVQAKRHVAVLLNLEHDDVAAKSMNRPSR